MEGQDDPALGVCGVGLAGLEHRGDLRHATEEEQEVSPLLRRVALVNPLEHPQIRPRVQLLRAGDLLLWGDRLIDHLDKTHAMAKIITMTIETMRFIITPQRHIGTARKMQSQDAKLTGTIQTMSTKPVPTDGYMTLYIHYLYGKQPAWHLQHRCPTKVLRKELDVNGSRHQHQSQI